MSSTEVPSAQQLRAKIVKSLRAQGFEVARNQIKAPDQADKDRLRDLHNLAVAHRLKRAKPGLVRHESSLLNQIADGRAVVPEEVWPVLTRVERGSEDELLFRYAALHWSIPVSSGYGRRLRFLVRDRSNGKLIGIIGLGDPVFALAVRDEWIGWDAEARRERLHHVLDAFVLGAVPPYSQLLAGKLVAMLASSQEVADECKRKYGGRTAMISGEERDGRLALVTTSSALGRSSIYNRLRIDGDPVAISTGFTQGSGDFHFSNGLYAAINQYAAEHCTPTAKRDEWGTGFRSRREIVKKVLRHLGMSDRWIYHGVKREVFVLPMAKNSAAFLRGEHSRLLWHHRSVDSIFDEFRERWLLPRAERDRRYWQFSPASWKLWD